MGGKSTPDTPDYAGAAQATAAGDLAAARAAASANRVNQYTPYGSLVYSQTAQNQVDQAAYDAAMAKYNQDLKAYQLSQTDADNALYGTDVNIPQPVMPNQSDFIVRSPDAGWSVTQSLSPTEQQKQDLNTQLELGLLGTAQTGLGYVDNLLSTGGTLDESKLAQPGIYGQDVTDAVLQRLQPQLDRDRASLRTRLANQGLADGSAAYNDAMTQQGQRENDLYTAASLQGINTALAARQQGIQEQYASQDRPLNIVNALRTGNQVNLPQFTSVPQQATTQGADLLGAAVQQGNAANQTYSTQQAASGANVGAAATIGAAMIL